MNTNTKQQLLETINKLLEVYVDEGVASPTPYSGTMTDKEIKETWKLLADTMKENGNV